MLNGKPHTENEKLDAILIKLDAIHDAIKAEGAEPDDRLDLDLHDEVEEVVGKPAPEAKFSDCNQQLWDRCAEVNDPSVGCKRLIHEGKCLVDNAKPAEQPKEDMLIEEDIDGSPCNNCAHQQVHLCLHKGGNMYCSTWANWKRRQPAEQPTEEICEHLAGISGVDPVLRGCGFNVEPGKLASRSCGSLKARDECPMEQEEKPEREFKSNDNVDTPRGPGRVTYVVQNAINEQTHLDVMFQDENQAKYCVTFPVSAVSLHDPGTVEEPEEKPASGVKPLEWKPKPGSLRAASNDHNGPMLLEYRIFYCDGIWNGYFEHAQLTTGTLEGCIAACNEYEQNN